MQFDWTTFALEIINFLVLLWLLKRFLYKPVLNMLDARQKRIHDQIAKAQLTHAEAENLKAEYASRLQNWQQEETAQRQQLKQELAEEREKKHSVLKRTLEDERAKMEAREKAAAQLQEANLTNTLRKRAYRASTAMLKRLASAELTAKIVDVLAEDLRGLSDERRQVLLDFFQEMENKSAVSVDVATAHPLTEKSRQTIDAALFEFIQHPVDLTYFMNPDLIAGVRVTMGEYVLHANLADDLAFFEEHDPHA
jgi:F-type H+-transporting ATPase subunit b